MCHLYYLVTIDHSFICTLYYLFYFNKITFSLLDPYVKVSLMCDGRRLKKRKTTTKKNTLNPVYNEAIIFDIPPENVEQVSLSIAVMDYDRYVYLSIYSLKNSHGQSRRPNSALQVIYCHNSFNVNWKKDKLFIQNLLFLCYNSFSSLKEVIIKLKDRTPRAGERMSTEAVWNTSQKTLV